MNFMIFKNNRPAGTTKFATWENARQALRKRLRKQTTVRYLGQPANNLAVNGIGGAFSYTALGYTIRKI